MRKGWPGLRDSIRRNKTGRFSEGEMTQDGRPDVFRAMVQHPELARGMEQDGDDLPGGGRDFVRAAVEVDEGAGMDLAC